MIWKAATEGGRGLDGPSSRSQGFSLAREREVISRVGSARVTEINRSASKRGDTRAYVSARGASGSAADPVEDLDERRGRGNGGVLSQMMGVEGTLEMDARRLPSEAIFRDQLDSSWR